MIRGSNQIETFGASSTHAGGENYVQDIK